MKNVFLFILAAIVFASCSNSTPLSLNLEEGESYTQNMVLKATVVQNFQGQNMELIMTVGGEMLYKVLEVKDDAYEMEVSYKSLSMDLAMPQGSMSYSSEDDKELVSLMLAEMKDKPFEITMTKTGKVTDLRNMDNLFNSMMSSFPEMSPMEYKQIEDQLREAYGKTAFKGSIEMITAIFPENGDISLDDTWEIETKISNGVSGNMLSTYTYKEDNSDYRLITGTAVIESLEGEDAKTVIGGMSAHYEIRGDMNSNIKIDPKTGWIIEANVKQEITGKAIVDANPQMPNGMVIPIIMKNDMKISN